MQQQPAATPTHQTLESSAKIHRLALQDSNTQDIDQLVQYYTESGPDYEDWSRNYHMHFGFYRGWSNPFRLESMLQEMSKQVLMRLNINENKAVRLLDVGCGLGATARFAPALFPRVKVTGITLVPWQIEQARQITRAQHLYEQVKFFRLDYTATPFADNTFDGLYAIESMCYAQGLAKADFINEAWRVLKPGQKLVVADGFYKHTKPMGRFMRFCTDRSCRFWAFDTFAGLEACTDSMRETGFLNIHIEEVSWRLVPSLAFVPLVAMKFLFKELFIKKTAMTRLRWGHVFAPFLGIFVGLARKRFGYYLITATK